MTAFVPRTYVPRPLRLPLALSLALHWLVLAALSASADSGGARRDRSLVASASVANVTISRSTAVTVALVGLPRPRSSQSMPPPPQLPHSQSMPPLPPPPLQHLPRQYQPQRILPGPPSSATAPALAVAPPIAPAFIPSDAPSDAPSHAAGSDEIATVEQYRVALAFVARRLGVVPALTHDADAAPLRAVVSVTWRRDQGERYGLRLSSGNDAFDQAALNLAARAVASLPVPTRLIDATLQFDLTIVAKDVTHATR